MELTALHDKLNYSVEIRNWDIFKHCLQPKSFLKDEPEYMKRKIIAKLAEILTRPQLDLPSYIVIIILKCLTNVCVSNPKHKTIDMIQWNSNLNLNYWNKIYEVFFMDDVQNLDDQSLVRIFMEYSGTNFPYDGVVQWIIRELDTISQSDSITLEQWEIMRLSFSFLCNITADIHGDLPKNIYNLELKQMIVNLLKLTFDSPGKLAFLGRLCCFIHNVINIADDYFVFDDLVDVIYGLYKADQLEMNMAQNIVMLILNKPKFQHDTYNKLSTELRLYSLEVFYEHLKDKVYSCSDDHVDYVPSVEIARFLAHQFKIKSDLILKTVDSYVKNLEPAEVTILLDILGVLTTTKQSDGSITLQSDSSLLINALYMLRALHMAGKESKNCFTPIQKLSEIVPSAHNPSINSNENIQAHPAFGFKVALIRLIGNLAYRHKKNQNTVRDNEGIPLLLDCCNIDARNPLIVQWTILAVRNLCEGNGEIQRLIGGSHLIETINNDIVQEFGIKLNLNDGGSSIGIVPLSSKTPQ